MLFILWLSLRNANLARYLPEPVQNYLQDLDERLGLSRRIRLPASYASFGQNSQDRGEAIANLSIHNGDSSDEEGDNDDELPLARRWENGHGGRNGFRSHAIRRKESTLNRLISLFTGRGQASAYGLLGGQSSGRSNGGYHLEEDDADEEAGGGGHILQLPNLNTSNSNPVRNHIRRSQPPTKKQKSSPSLFTLDTADLDAPALAPNFTLSPSRTSQSNPFASFSEGLGSPRSTGSPNIGYGFPRSPIRSPSISRTLSLVAIAEETSLSPRGSSETVERPNFAQTASMSRSASTDSGTSSSYGASSRAEDRSLPDWASAVSTQRPRSNT